jgi:hypothetical protein
MIIYSDAEKWKICVYDSLACMIMTGDGSQYKQPDNKADVISVFTALAGKGEGGTATYLSNSLKECAKDPLVIGVDPSISSTALRVGGAIQTCHHPRKISKFNLEHFISALFYFIICLHIYVCIYMYRYIHMNVFIYIYMYMYTYICMHIHVYVYIYIYMYRCTVMYCIIFLFLGGDIMKTITRSGHALEDVNNVLHYIMQCDRVQIDSGKLAGNWEDPMDPCLPASSWHFITRANKELVFALVRHLFNTRWNIFDSHLRSFVLTMFATVLRTLPERIAEFGEDTLINVVLQKAFRKFKISKEIVNGWILAVKKGWEDDNVSSLTTNVVLHNEVKELRLEICDLKQEAIKSYGLQCEIMNMLKNNNFGTVRSDSVGCPDIGVNGGSDNGVIVQVDNVKDLGTIVNTAGGAVVVENVSIEAGTKDSNIGTKSDNCDATDISIIVRDSNVKDRNNIVNADGPCVAGPSIAPVDPCIAPVGFVGSIVGPGIGSIGFVGSGVGPGIAPVDRVSPGLDPGIGSVSGDFGGFDVSDESLHGFPDDSVVEGDSGAGTGNSLNLTVSIDHIIGTSIDTATIFKKKGRGSGKNNKSTKPKNNKIRAGKPP